MYIVPLLTRLVFFKTFSKPAHWREGKTQIDQFLTGKGLGLGNFDEFFPLVTTGTRGFMNYSIMSIYVYTYTLYTIDMYYIDVVIYVDICWPQIDTHFFYMKSMYVSFFMSMWREIAHTKIFFYLVNPSFFQCFVVSNPLFL